MRALQAVQGWIADLPTQKWTPLAVSEGARTQLAAFAQERGLDGVSVLVDHELYQTRTWGVSHLPSLYLISPKGRVLMKVIGDRDGGFGVPSSSVLSAEIDTLVAAEAAAKRAAEEKAAAEAAAKK